MNNMKDYIDNQIKRGNYNITEFIKEDKYELVDMLIYTLNRFSNKVELILFDSFETIIFLTQKEWKVIISSLNDIAEYYFDRFLISYCFLDKKYLEDLGLLDDRINELTIRSKSKDRLPPPLNFIGPLTRVQARMKKFRTLPKKKYLYVYYIFCYSCPVHTDKRTSL